MAGAGAGSGRRRSSRAQSLRRGGSGGRATSASSVTFVPQPAGSSTTRPQATSPSQATRDSPSQSTGRTSPNGSRWRASAVGSDNSAHSSGTDFTRVRLAWTIGAGLRPPRGRPCTVHGSVRNLTHAVCGTGTFRHVEGGARPLELILARNLLASLSTPAFLVDHRGEIAFYNDAAGGVLGRRYEDSGPMPIQEWTDRFGPFDEQGKPIHFDRLDFTKALLRNHPAHDRFCMRELDGSGWRTIEMSALPIVGTGGYRGAMVWFWPAEEEDG